MRVNIQVVGQTDEQTSYRLTSEQEQTDGKDMRIIHSNDGNHVVTEHWSLLTCMNTFVDTGDVLGANSLIETGDTGISLVRSYNIISKASCNEGTKTKLLRAI